MQKNRLVTSRKIIGEIVMVIPLENISRIKSQKNKINPSKISTTTIKSCQNWKLRLTKIIKMVAGIITVIFSMPNKIRKQITNRNIKYWSPDWMLCRIDLWKLRKVTKWEKINIFLFRNRKYHRDLMEVMLIIRKIRKYCLFKRDNLISRPSLPLHIAGKSNKDYKFKAQNQKLHHLKYKKIQENYRTNHQNNNLKPK